MEMNEIIWEDMGKLARCYACVLGPIYRAHPYFVDMLYSGYRL